MKMKSNQPFIDLLPVRREMISVGEYLRLMTENPALIEQAEFMPPRIGGNDFGAFFVRYNGAQHKSVTYGR
jgi:hypothetical protein